MASSVEVCHRTNDYGDEAVPAPIRLGQRPDYLAWFLRPLFSCKTKTFGL